VEAELNPGWYGTFSTIKMGSGLDKMLVMHSANKASNQTFAITP